MSSKHVQVTEDRTCCVMHLHSGATPLVNGHPSRAVTTSTYAQAAASQSGLALASAKRTEYITSPPPPNLPSLALFVSFSSTHTTQPRANMFKGLLA